jgi:hypothetical protein
MGQAVPVALAGADNPLLHNGIEESELPATGACDCSGSDE